MYHSITIGNKHTYKDFGLIPTSRPVVNPPSPNFSYLEIPGVSGSLDLSEAVSGNITYADRTGSFEFYVRPGRDWSEVYDSILSFLHGQRLAVTLEDDPTHFYVGRVSVNQWKSDKNHSFIELDYQLRPFKYEMTTIKSVPWSVGNATEHMGYRMVSVSVTTTLSTSITVGGTMPIVPILWVTSLSGSLTLTVNSKTYTLTSGKNRIPELSIQKETSLFFKGKANIGIYTRRGWL
ncbi:hypothetical protein [uncultured Clostridium sp.]|uniref:hypothetical protein n=1 Tax=uncultured Clostridium sp. TaxID=59620 RepID=UPI0025FC9D38|nr:hypothetical protein [uncultured Clostridium sp.]